MKIPWPAAPGQIQRFRYFGYRWSFSASNSSYDEAITDGRFNSYGIQIKGGVSKFQTYGKTMLTQND